jgi:hypothetical protein
MGEVLQDDLEKLIRLEFDFVFLQDRLHALRELRTRDHFLNLFRFRRG